MKITYQIHQPSEISAGIIGFTDTVTVIVESGDPGGEPEEFKDHILDALKDWYDGAKITVDVEKAESDFIQKLTQNMVDAPPEFSKTVDENFWDLMDKKEQKTDRKEILLRATYDLLKKCDEWPYVANALETTVFYDDAECDGNCLMDDIAIELGIEE